jgi:hypothetical protein
MKQSSNAKITVRNKNPVNYFKGKPYSIDKFTKEIGITHFKVRKWLSKGWTMDEIAEITESTENHSFSGFSDSSNFQIKVSNNDQIKVYTFRSEQISIREFCNEYAFPEDIVSLMVQNGLEIDDIYSCWERWIRIGVIHEWQQLARSNFKSVGAKENTQISIAVEHDSPTNIKDADRIKSSMSKPIDPKKSGAFYYLENYHYRPII